MPSDIEPTAQDQPQVTPPLLEHARSDEASPTRLRRGKRLTTIGNSILGSAVILGVLAFMPMRLGLLDDYPLLQLLVATVVVVCFVGAIVSVFMLRAGRRHLAQGAREVLATDNRPPVIYLRSFTVDKQNSRVEVLNLSLLTREEQLTKALDCFGPLVAIGRPGEALPTLGAARAYVDDAHWQEEVTILLRSASLVLLYIGNSEGLKWEVSSCLKAVAPRKLILLVPNDRNELESFIANNADKFPKGLPTIAKRGRAPEGPVRGIIYFEDDWTPVLQIQRRRYSRYLTRLLLCEPPADTRFIGAIDALLEPVRTRSGILWPVPARGIRRIGATAIDAGIMVAAFTAVIWAIVTHHTAIAYLAGLVLAANAVLLELTPARAALGKLLLGLKTVDARSGRNLPLVEALSRCISKGTVLVIPLYWLFLPKIAITMFCEGIAPWDLSARSVVRAKRN